MDKAQRRAVGSLFYVYGNAGPYHTKGNHEFLRRTLEGESNPEHYQPTADCKAAFEKVMAGDYSPLPVAVRERLKKMEEDEARLRAAAGVDDG